MNKENGPRRVPARTAQRPIELVLGKLPDAKQSSKGWAARCPVHDDQSPSLSISEGNDGRVLVHCHSGCSTDAVCAALGITVADLFPPEPAIWGPARKGKVVGRIVATYDYRDEHGKPLFQVVRFDPKGFAQRRPDGKGDWVWNLNGVRRVLYQLLELLAADPTKCVFVVEGEKDADRLASLGLIATTNPCGAGKWHLVDDAPLHGRRIAILPDNDDAGRKHAEDVASRLHGKAVDLRDVELPELPPKGDVSNWLDAGHSVAELLALVEAETPYTPQPPDDALKVIPWAPFPVDVLPNPLRKFITVAAQALGVDPSFIALPLLATCAGAIGNSRRIRLKRSWTEPAIIWAVIVAASGTIKTPAIQKAVVALYKRYKRARKNYAEQLKRTTRELAEYKAAKQDKKRTELLPDMPKIPAVERVIVSDITIEMLAVLHKDNPRGLIVVRDELAAWLLGFNQYRGGRGADLQHWEEMHSGISMIVDRKGSDPSQRQSYYISRAAVSVTGGIQPGTLQRVLTPEFFESGLVARILFTMPPERTKQWTEEDVPEEVEAEMDQLVDRLLLLQPDSDEDGEPVPKLLHFTRLGKARFVAFYNEHAQEQAALTGDLRSAWSKLEGYVPRLALVLHCVRYAVFDSTLADPDRVDEISVDAAIKLVRWFGNEDRRLYALLSESPDEHEDRELVEVIQRRGGRITVRDLMHAKARYRIDSEKAEIALNSLVRLGQGRWIDVSSGTRGGRPTRTLELCGAGSSNTTLKNNGKKGVPLLLP